MKKTTCTCLAICLDTVIFFRFVREKLQLEKDNAQTEADIKIGNGEVTMLQKELDAITATLQQLENQKEQAQKCLDELDEKVTHFSSLDALRLYCTQLDTYTL